MDPPPKQTKLPPFKVSQPPVASAGVTPRVSSSTSKLRSVDEDSNDDSTTFPAPNSAQRASSSLMPPPASSLASRSGQALAPAKGLAPPPTSTLVPKSASAAARARTKIALAPGHSPMDWARLTNSGANLRGTDAPTLLIVSKEELSRHNTLDDMWTVLGGRVYNVTPYVPFHPGGAKILKGAAGRDGTALFMKTHAWVSYENILAKTLVGVYRP